MKQLFRTQRDGSVNAKLASFQDIVVMYTTRVGEIQAIKIACWNLQRKNKQDLIIDEE